MSEFDADLMAKFVTDLAAKHHANLISEFAPDFAPEFVTDLAA